MKKIYSFLVLAFLGAASLAHAANGTVSFQIDQNLGSGEPDLLPVETESVNASFENGVLKIDQMFYGFLPLELTINMETGEAIAADQEAMNEDGMTFYYYDVESKETELVGTLSNVGTDKCQLVLQPWGPGDYFPGYGVFFNVAFYNTIFVFDFSIPGLDETVEEPILEIESVNYVPVTTDYGLYLEFTVQVTSENLPEGSEIEVFFKGPYDDDFKSAEENENGTFGFFIAGVQPEVEYAVELYAKAGTVVSKTETFTFTLDGTGIESLFDDFSSSKFYNLKGVEVNELKQGEVYIKVNNGKAQKVLIK